MDNSHLRLGRMLQTVTWWDRGIYITLPLGVGGNEIYKLKGENRRRRKKGKNKNKGEMKEKKEKYKREKGETR